jgi:hypothetical protein
MYCAPVYVLFWLLISCLCSGAACAAPAFEDRFTSAKEWDVLDFSGDATLRVGQDSTVPPGYGPEVLLVEGDHVLGLAKSVRMTEGTLVVLYRERNPRDRDADGVLVFDAQYGDDLSVEHNTKLIRPMMWFELDNDSGVHVRAKLDATHEMAYAQQSGVGLVTDEWNKTNWIWQKVRIEGSEIFAKYWPAHQVEPEDWTLRTVLKESRPGRVGFRIGSGAIAIAYFAFDPNDIRPSAPAFYLVPVHEQTIRGQPFLLDLYCNSPDVDESYSLAIMRGDMELSVAAIERKRLCANPGLRFAIVPPGCKYDNPERLVIKSATDGDLLRAVVRDSAGTILASCPVTCARSTGIDSQLAALDVQLSAGPDAGSNGIETRVRFDVARAHRELAAERLQVGDHEGAARSLRYALNALREPESGSDSGQVPKRLWRENVIVDTPDGPRVRVLGRFGAEAAQLRFEFHADGKLAGAGTGLELASGILVQPFMGEYTVVCDDKALATAQGVPARLLATVVETRDGQIWVNGESFLVKGVNVHSLDGGNRERSRKMVRILKRLGFNTLRGDHPPLWQVEMAHQENMAWSVLAPFSCDSTDEIFAKLDGPPMVAARAKSRDFIHDYSEMPGVLLWNSCNEIGNETTDFLVSIYPVYKHHDPYGRPVHYANLYGQDRWQGQDIMAVNYYFAPGQTPADRQPMIRRSINIAKAHGLPIIYTEYNSYHGPIPEKGVEAIYGLFQWGIENGMSGGFMYDKWMGEQHPGVFNKNLEVDPGMERAFVDVFADARIAVEERRGATARLRITNKRQFSLRSFRLEVGGREWPVPDLDPLASASVTLPVGEDAVQVQGHMRFVTHHGFRSDIPFVLALAEDN